MPKQQDPKDRPARRAEGWLWTLIMAGGFLLVVLLLQSIGVLR